MSKELHTAEEAHFLVRVGQWSIERLHQWMRDNVDAEYDWEEHNGEFDQMFDDVEDEEIDEL